MISIGVKKKKKRLLEDSSISKVLLKWCSTVPKLTNVLCIILHKEAN